MRLREVRDFCIDFGIMKFIPSMNIVKIVQLYQTVHPGKTLDEKNDIGLNLYQFTDFLILCSQEMYR